MKKNKVPSLVTLAILTLITVVFWVFFSVYRVFTKKEPYVVPEEILTPVDPNLDSNILTKLTERKYLEESLIPDIQIEGAPSLTIPTQEASPTAQPTNLPEETPSESPTPIPSPSGAATQ